MEDQNKTKEKLINELIELRKQAERALGVSEDRYRNIFNYANEAILIIDSNGIIIETNPKASDIYGYSHEEFMGLPVKKLIHPEDAHIFYDHAEIY